MLGISEGLGKEDILRTAERMRTDVLKMAEGLRKDDVLGMTEGLVVVE